VGSRQNPKPQPKPEVLVVPVIPEAPAEGKQPMSQRLWGWQVVGTFGPLIWGAGIAAMYGDDYKTAVGLYFVGIGLLTGKFLSWKEHRHYPRRKKIGIWTITTAVATLAFVGSLYWIGVRQSDVNASQVRGIAPASAVTPPTPRVGKSLLDLYKMAENDGARLDQEFSFQSRTSQGKISFRGAALVDSSTQTYSIRFYIPASPMTIEICSSYSNKNARVYQLIRENIKKWDSGIDPSLPLPASFLTIRKPRFSGKVIFYHETSIPMSDRVKLMEDYERNDMAVQFRGMDYVLMQALSHR